MNYFLEFSQTSSELSQTFFPPLTLKSNSNYVLGLYSLTTYNSIPNIIADKNNAISFITKQKEAEKGGKTPAAAATKEEEFTILIPTGCYEIAQIGEYLSKKLKSKNITFSLNINPNTMRVEMESSHKIKFPANSMRRFLGFTKNAYDAGSHISELLPEISNINIIDVQCDIIDNSFSNGVKSHSIYSFTPNVESGYKMIERPATILFLPVRHREISNITLRLTDQSGQLVHFNNEEITIHLVLKEL